ncbi:hypothetical protein ACMFMG_003280 [Clarireedia jacksonii]
MNQPLRLRLDVLPSDQPCGFGNLTLDGQFLPQGLDADTLVSSGKGSVLTSTKNVIVGSWTFNCIVVNGKPYGQLLQFVVDFVDGKSAEDNGFSVLFKQTGKTEIINIETQPFTTAHIVANHFPEDHGAKGHHQKDGDSMNEHKGFEGHHLDHSDVQGPQRHFNVHQEIHELRYMEAQLEELKWLIHKKKHAIRRFAHDSMDGGIMDCDSLRCVARKTYDNARGAASKIYGKITGDDTEFDNFFDSHPRTQEGREMDKKPGKGYHERPDNHTSHDHTKKNHTLSHSHHHEKRPILPICHYPPPFPGPHPHGHGPPPPHMPPPEFAHGRRPPMPPPHHGDRGSAPWDHDSRPHHNGPFGGHWDLDEELEDNQEEVRPASHDDKPYQLDMPDKPDHPHGPPPFDKPFYGPPHGSNGAEPEHDGPTFDEPPPFHDGPPPFHNGPHDDPPGFSGNHGPPPYHDPGQFLHVIKFVVIGFLFAILITTICRRTCNPKKRTARQARREERHRKRAYRRAASRYALSTWWARLTSSGDNYDDDEEKREALLDDIDSDSESTMSDDITTFQNAANVVSDMVAAEEGRSVSSVQMQQHPIATETRQMDSVIEGYASDAEEEVLPAYEDNDNDGSEASSFVADGFRYTPGSSDYSPSHSASGSVSDISGKDSKQ